MNLIVLTMIAGQAPPACQVAPPCPVICPQPQYSTASSRAVSFRQVGPAWAVVPSQGNVAFVPGITESEVPAKYRMKAHDFAYKAELERKSGPVRVFHVTFPSPHNSPEEQNNTIHGHYYQPPGVGPFPAVVVLHILEGGFELSHITANTLARNGIAALFVRLPYYGERRGRIRRRLISFDIKQTLESVSQGVLDIRRATTWLASRPEVDRNRMGLTGISLGGIVSALGGGIEPRLKKIAITLGGAGMADMVWEHTHSDADWFRRQWTKAGGTRESLVATMAPIEPLTYAHRLAKKDVLMVAAKHDEIVPPQTARRLHASLKKHGGEPTLIWLDSGHISAGVYLYGEIRRLVRFFQIPPTARP